MRVDAKKPKQPVTSIPRLLDLFKQNGPLNSRELANLLGKNFGAAAVTRCRQLGIPLQRMGSLNGSKLRTKLYALDSSVLWHALEEAVRQIDKYALILTSQDHLADRRTYGTVAEWIQHAQRIRKLKGKKPVRTNGSLHKTRQAPHQ
jgi:hypothetical protein